MAEEFLFVGCEAANCGFYGELRGTDAAVVASHLDLQRRGRRGGGGGCEEAAGASVMTFGLLVRLRGLVVG